MSKLNVTLAGREEIASATWAFTLDLGGREFSFRAGQTIDVTFPDPPYQDALGNRRTFSLAAAPGRDHLLVATRVRGSAFKRSLLEAPPGTGLEIEGPFGSFTLPQRATSVVMLAGGIGITPFRAITEDAIGRRLEHSLLLIHSNRTPEEAPFLEELQGWSRSNPRFVYRPTMTQSVDSARAWTGERRRVGRELLADLLPADRNGPLYYVAGPERFVKGVVDALASVNVQEDRIRFEEFAGY
jgi:ferredoxin-NADP reductase